MAQWSRGLDLQRQAQPIHYDPGGERYRLRSTDRIFPGDFEVTSWEVAIEWKPTNTESRTGAAIGESLPDLLLFCLLN